MGDAVGSVAPDELILRRIIKGPGHYDRSKALPLERGAFTPNRSDDDGLSFYIEREQSIADLVRLANRPSSDVVIIRFTAGDIYSLDLTLVPMMRQGDLPGHIVIPEINYNDYQDKRLKPRIKLAGEALVRLGLERIVFGA